jgi:hypothetical protein
MSKLRLLRASRGARLLLLLLVLCGVTAATVPVPGRAVVCCSYSYTITYYSDATHSKVVGSCTFNEACAGDDFCSGVRSAYYVRSALRCCPNCVP